MMKSHFVIKNINQNDFYFWYNIFFPPAYRKGSTKRGTKTEKAEDELLLQEELEDTSNKLTYLTTTPSCITLS